LDQSQHIHNRASTALGMPGFCRIVSNRSSKYIQSFVIESNHAGLPLGKEDPVFKDAVDIIEDFLKQGLPPLVSNDPRKIKSF